jgi:4-amino-4-deoxy-L-arabinose transferase-like glycosyltransferase
LNRRPADIGRLAMTPAEWLWLGAITAIALALRLAYLDEIREHPLFRQVLGDPALYLRQALDIMQGKVVPDHAYFHSSPMYPFFLALVRVMGGTSLESIRVVQSLVGTLSVGLVFVLGRLTVGKRTGLFAASFAAVYTPLIFFEGELLEITLVMAFVLGALILLHLADRDRGVWKTIGAGALLGLAGLGKPNLLLFAPVGSLWLALHGRSGRELTRARLLPAALFFLAAGAVILPATVHNYRVSGDFIPVSSNAGINFFIGNHHNSPGVFQIDPEMRFNLRVASKQIAERAEGRPLSAGEVSAFWARRARTQILSDPGRWLGLLGRKFVLFWNYYEIPNHYHMEYVKRFAPILRIPIGTFGVVAPLGLVGFGLALKRRKQVGLLVLFGLTYMASVVPFFITGRYRLAIVAVLLVGAGYAVTVLWAALRSRDFRTLSVVLLCVAVIAVAVGRDTIEFGFASMYNAVGGYLGRTGDMAGAAEQFRKAVKENPEDLSSRYNLGLALLELGRYEDAAVQFERAVRAHPRYFEAWIGLARARAGMGMVEPALEALGAVTDARPPAPGPLVAEAEQLSAALRSEDTCPETESNG